MSVPKNVLNRLVKLPKELIIVDFIPHVRHDEIVVEIPRPETVPCPYCNSEHCNIKDNGRKRSVHHLAFGSRGTMITFKQRRYICKDCEHSFQEPVYWVMDNIRITGALYLEICRDLQTTASIIDIAKRNAVSESIVRHVLEATPAYVPPHLPKTLCIDEFSGSAGHWDTEQSRWIVSDYHCNLVDGDHGTVYDILPSPNKAYLFEYFYALPSEERGLIPFSIFSLIFTVPFLVSLILTSVAIRIVSRELSYLDHMVIIVYNKKFRHSFATTTTKPS